MIVLFYKKKQNSLFYLNFVKLKMATGSHLEFKKNVNLKAEMDSGGQNHSENMFCLNS